MQGSQSSTILPKISSTPSEKHSHANPNKHAANPFNKQPPKTLETNPIPPIHSPNTDLSQLDTNLKASPNPSTQQIDNIQTNNILNPSDEINEGESIEVLRARNIQLRNELKLLNEQLNIHLAKKKPFKSDVHGSPGRNSPAQNTPANQEKKLTMEMESARKQLDIYKKEWRTNKKRYEEIDDPTRIIKVEQKIIEIERSITTETANNKALTKELREKNKLIDFLQSAAIINPKEVVKGDGVEHMRKKYDQAELKEDRLKAQAVSKEDYIYNLEVELRKLRQSFDKGLELTGLTEDSLKRPSNNATMNTNRRMKSQSVSKIRVPALTDRGRHGTKASAHAWRNGSVEENDLEFTTSNFKKLEADVKILEKSDAVKEKSRNRDLQALQGHVLASEEAKTELENHLAERDKELETLKAVYRELNDILLKNHVQVPSFERKRVKPTESPRAATDEAPTKRVEKVPVASKIQKKGDFNDKELLGNKKVKICGVRVWHNHEKLSGIQAIYRLQDGTKIEGKRHIEDAFRYKAVKFDMDEKDYLKDLTGFLNAAGDSVESLVFKSKSGQVRKVGKASPDSKQFRFDVQQDEIPAIIYGSVSTGPEGTFLSRLGILIAADDPDDEVDQNESAQTGNDGDFFAATALPSERFVKATKAK